MDDHKRDAEVGSAPAGVAAPGRSWGGLARYTAMAFGALVVAVILYYVLGAFYLNRIDADPGFFETVEVPTDGSATVAVAAALIEREVDTHPWLANDPAFMPSYVLDNTPNFQQGIVAALSRFAVELTDQIARVRGSSRIDRDAEQAAGRLKYPGDVWFLEWSTTPVQPSSESQYRLAMDNLRAYNRRLADGEAVFERRADNLLAALDRISSDIGSSSAAVYEHIDRNAGNFLDWTADDLFYMNKGKMYAYYMLFKGLERDFADVIGRRDLTSVWTKMMTSMEVAVRLEPWIIMNGPLDAQFTPNHLSAQGFLLLRMRTQLREVTNILLK